MIARERLLEIVSLAQRAPSLHNVQNARWKVTGSRVELYEVRSVRLPASDPGAIDALRSLGAAWESFLLAASLHDFEVHEVEQFSPGTHSHSLDANLDLVCRGTLAGAAQGPHPLAGFLSQRRSHRLPFPAQDEDVLAPTLAALKDALSPDAFVLAGQSTLKTLSAWADDAVLDLLGKPGVLEELRAWSRFSSNHPRWNLDGLNARCLGLGPLEGRAAAALLHPQVFRRLANTLGVLPGALEGLGKLVGDGEQIRSSHALVFLTSDTTTQPFEEGRCLLREWLALTAAGWSAAPVSSLVDHPRLSTLLADVLALPPGKRVFHALRAGVGNVSKAPLSPRLPANEILL